MRIGELSERTGVGTHSLRYYETRGLLEPERGHNGYREYAEESVQAVAQIRSLLAAGLTTDDIRVLLPCAVGDPPRFEACEEIVETLRSRLSGLEEQIEGLAASRRHLRRYVDVTTTA